MDDRTYNNYPSRSCAHQFRVINHFTKEHYNGIDCDIDHYFALECVHCYGEKTVNEYDFYYLNRENRII